MNIIHPGKENECIWNKISGTELTCFFLKFAIQMDEIDFEELW